MVLIKLGKQQTGVWAEWVEMQIAIPVQVLGLVCEKKLHKQSLEGLGPEAVYCCQLFLLPVSLLLPELVWLCQESSSGRPHSATHSGFVNVKYQ